MTAATNHTLRHPLLTLEYKSAATVQGLEHKVTNTQPNAGDVLNIDEDEGLVTAIVSVTGIEDHVKDVIQVGSYAATLTNRRPKVVQHHDWKQPGARVEEVVELPPGDPRLPKETKDGKPWPREAGALVATMRYNLKTAAGRDAFEWVKFYSESGECEWSIGYKVPPGKSTRTKDGVRQIKAIDLYEISFVLFGAAPFTGTLAVKSQDQANAETPAENPATETGQPAPAPGQPGEQAAEDEDADEDDPADVPVPEVDGDVDWEAIEDGAHLTDPAVFEGSEEAPDERDGTGAGDDTGGAPEQPEADAEPTADDGADGEVPGQGSDGQDGGGEIQGGGGEGEGKGIDDRVWYDSQIKRMVPPGKRRTLAKAGAALPDGSYPIENEQDLRNAVRAFGRAKPADRDQVRRHIIKRARALGKLDLLPGGWTSGKALDALEQVDGKGSGASLDRSPGKNWVELTGELPRYIREIARSLHNKRGMPLSQAIPMAIGVCKRWARGGDNVDADTRAKAAKAIAEWEQLKAKARTRRSGKAADGYDPAAEVGPDAGHQPPPQVVESKLYPRLPGTFEETRDLLHQALSKRVFPADGAKAPFLSIDGTWPDCVVATWFPPGQDPVTYEIGYDIDAAGKVWLAEPEEVKLTASVGDGSADDLLPHPAVLEQIADGLRTTLLHESKSGRVLSAVNARRLRGAVEQLVAVLDAAGIPIGEEEPVEEDPEPVTVPDSTAPSAQSGDVKTLIDPKLHARALRIFAEANSV